MAGWLLVVGLLSMLGATLELNDGAVVSGVLLLVGGAVCAAAGVQVAWLHSPGSRGVTRRMIRSSLFLLVPLLVAASVLAVALGLRQDWGRLLVVVVTIGAILGELSFVAKQHDELQASTREDAGSSTRPVPSPEP